MSKGYSHLLEHFIWTPWINDSSETCPPFGCFRVTDSQGYYVKGAKPDSTIGKSYGFNSQTAVPAGGTGLACFGPVALAAYDIGTPANGEGWGPKSGQWTLANDGTQIVIIQGIVNTANKIALAHCIGTPNRKLQGTAKGNWRKQGTDWPSAYYVPSGTPTISQIGYVIVDNVTGYDPATEFTVYLPTGPGRDPNVVDGQIITFEQVPDIEDPQNAGNPYYEATCNYDDDAIGTVKMLFATSDPDVQPGWNIADGGQDTAKTFTGAAVDMTDRFPLGNWDYTTAGSGDLTIKDEDIATAAGGLTAGTAIAAGTDFSNSLAGNGGDIVLTHNATGGFVAGDNYVPKHRGVYFIERIDNSSA